MPAFNMAQLRSKAEQGLSSARERADRLKSAPTSHAPGAGAGAGAATPRPAPRPAPPPPPPRRGLSSALSPSPSSGSGSAPGSAPAPAPSPSPSPLFSQISSHDKLALFALLDHYFESRTRPDTPHHPPVPLWARPSQQDHTQDTNHSHTHSSQSLCEYFRSSTTWPQQWYTAPDSTPPVLKNRSDVQFCSSWTQSGSRMTRYGGVLFEDLSIAWYTVQWDSHSPSQVSRSARYTLPPHPLDAQTLYTAYESYSEGIALFAENALQSQQPVGRGECWDLASHALKQFDQWPQIPRPIPSLGKTHGHLIFQGTPGAGSWRGGDNQIRRGDIVQWRLVEKIRQVGMPSTSYCSLGSPDHTAIIVSESLPQISVHDGTSIRPNQLAPLHVIEQSPGKIPTKAAYDLSTMESGELSIYRPVSLETYIKYNLSPQCPDVQNTYSLE